MHMAINFLLYYKGDFDLWRMEFERNTDEMHTNGNVIITNCMMYSNLMKLNIVEVT